MRFKMMVIGVTLVLIAILFHQYEKQDVFTLTDRGRETPNCVNVLFFDDSSSDNIPYSVLSGARASDLLYKIKHEACRTNIGVMCPNNKFNGIRGRLCIIPEWMAFLPYAAMPYLRKCVHTLYDPQRQLLYLSEDCSELYWDFYEGFCVSNVPPTMLGVDAGKIELHFNEHYCQQKTTSRGNKYVSE